jgi:hypothetical protein
MDPLRFRQRKLFRPASIEYFVGAFGDSGMPELLAPRRTRWTFLAVSALVSVVIAWGLTGSLPVRVQVQGKLVGPDDTRPYFRGNITVAYGQVIRSGQQARIAISASPLLMAKGQVELYTEGSAKEIVIMLDRTSAYPWAVKQGLSSWLPATAWVTVGRQTPWRFLRGRLFHIQSGNELI